MRPTRGQSRRQTPQDRQKNACAWNSPLKWRDALAQAIASTRLVPLSSSGTDLGASSGRRTAGRHPPISIGACLPCLEIRVRALPEQTSLITGATDGLGRALALELARAGATLLLHGRDDARGQATLAQIRDQSGNDRLHWYRADLSDLREVRRLAAEIGRDRERLDVLVSNAGIGTVVPGGGRRQESAQGHELRFAVNYLAGFLLTRLLQPLVVSSAPARIIHVASAGQAPIDFDDVMLTRRYSGMQAYCQSKLAQIMFTFDLAEQLAAQKVAANALHPATYMPTKIVANPISSIADGVRATARLITKPELDAVTGRYYDGTREATAHVQAYDPLARRRLRELSERLTAAA